MMAKKFDEKASPAGFTLYNSAVLHFRFYPLRLEFTAKDRLSFPSGLAANTLRGALGLMFRKIACAPACPGAKTCERRASCPYARLLEPTAIGESPSGLADWPRPFVFRARHLDGRVVERGESFRFDLNVFSLDPDVLSQFAQTFAELSKEGMGPGR